MGQAKEINTDKEHQALLKVAQRVFWWTSPEEALKDPQRFVAQVMTYGNWDDVQLTRRAFGQAAFRAVLDRPPPGVFDKKSWAYWHAVFHLSPVPPLPKRNI